MASKNHTTASAGDVTFDFEMLDPTIPPPVPPRRGVYHRCKLRREVLKPIDESEEWDDEPPNVFGLELEPGVYLIRYYWEFRRLMNLIGKLDSVGVLLGGDNVGETGTVPWILLSYQGKVFHIDMYRFVYHGLGSRAWAMLAKDVFSNAHLTKVMHGSRSAALFLEHSQDILLRNVFDTWKADHILSHNTRGAPTFGSLSACLEFYGIEMPAEKLRYLRLFENQDPDRGRFWNRRPRPSDNFMEFGTLQVKYLLALREEQANRLMRKFMRCVEENLGIVWEMCSGFWFFNPTLASPDMKQNSCGPGGSARVRPARSPFP